MRVVLRRSFAWSVVVLLGAGWVGCGAGAVGQAVRPADPTAANALGESPGGASLNCTTAPKRGEPLVVDWKTNDQLDLTVALKKGIAVVSYDCKSLKLLKDCSAQGKYGFTSVSSVLQESVKINNADEVQATLPFSGGSIGGGMGRDSSIDIALAYVGKRAALDDSVARGDLTGSECDQATHFVRGATIGAFVMQTGTKGEVHAAGELFGVGASGQSSSAKQRLNAAGDIDACKSIKDGMDNPPDACAAVVRLELVALGEVVKDGVKDGLPNTCPDGYAMSGGYCTKKSSGGAYRCQPDDGDDCKAQCAKGNAESCRNASKFAKDLPEQVKFLKTACDGAVGGACGELAFIYMQGSTDARYHDNKAGTDYARKGCDLLDSWACFYLGVGGQGLSADDKHAAFKKACDLGMAGQCVNVARDDLAGPTKHTQEGLGYLDADCSAGHADGCREAAFVYGTGHLKGGKDGSTEVSPDPAKAADYQAKFCKVSPTECGPGYGGDYKSAGDAKALTFKQVANEVSFSSSVGDTKCTISGGTTLRCSFKNDKKKTSGEGILNRDANGKLSGSYIVEHNASGNVSSPKETKWEFSPKK